MRSIVTEYELTAPASLDALLATLANEPGQHAIIAGGTEIMVQLGVGRLTSKSLLSINHLRELRFITIEDDAIILGSGATFTDIRNNAVIVEEFPLMASSASWTGTIANQNRATLGGNICNASPAADTPPALLAYGATVTLVSSTSKRTIPYSEFHLGYKKIALRPDEILHSIRVPRTFASYRQYIRKVGTRNALAISKIAIAALAKLDGETLRDIRIGAASLSEMPMRCKAAEAALVGKTLNADTIDQLARETRAALATEARPIDDIRSTAKYRAAVAANLVEEFLRSLLA